MHPSSRSVSSARELGVGAAPRASAVPETFEETRTIGGSLVGFPLRRPPSTDKPKRRRSTATPPMPGDSRGEERGGEVQEVVPS
eukprot:5724724-Pyramimonas_sp.AAC.1